MQILSSIQGQTKVCGIFGHPVGHSFSPVLQNTLFRALQIPAVYTAFDVAPEHLPAAVQGAFAMGLWGLNITIPHKKEVMALLTGIDPLAAQIGAVNTLCRRENGFWGYNTDILGLKKCFALHGHCLSQAQVLVLGAGGAANAAAFWQPAKGQAISIWQTAPAPRQKPWPPRSRPIIPSPSPSARWMTFLPCQKICW